MSFLASRKGRLSLVGSAVFVSSLVVSHQGLAASNGQPSKDGSTGTAEITVNVPKMVRLTGLQDITVSEQQVSDAVSAGNDITVNSNACVGGNGSFTYKIKAVSANTDSTDYRLADQAANQFVAYTVTWGGNPLTHDSDLPGQTLDQNNLGNTCTAPSGANKVAITIDDAALVAVNHGAYADTLTVTVVPE